MKKTLLFSMLAGLAIASVNAATIYSTNFEANPSANFTTVISGNVADTEVNFAYDYATWTPTAPTDITSITLAPNSTAGQTKALKMRANFAGGLGNNNVPTVYLNPSTGLTSWVLTFDCYQMWNGPTSGGTGTAPGTGTTTGFTIGNATTASPMYTGADTPPSSGFNGWFVTWPPEAGNGTDLRYYSGTNATPVLNQTPSAAAPNPPNWQVNGTPINVNMNFDPLVQALFPAIHYDIAGSCGRNWITWELKYVGGVVTLSCTPRLGVKTIFAQWNDVASNKTIGLGFWDGLNPGSGAVPPEDNFVLIDNLKLENPPPPPTAAQSWQLYN